MIACESLEELILSNNSLTNKHAEELALKIKTCQLSRLRKIDLSSNKLSVKGVLAVLQALRGNLHMKVSHLYFDRALLEKGQSQESISNFY